MNIKKLIKKALKVIFAKRPIHVTANITSAAPSELLKGRCALITGGTSGIGFAIAKAFLDAGASVVITGRSQERLSKACAALCCDGRVYSCVLDNRDIKSFASTFQSILDKIRRREINDIDILVNNAGVLGACMPNADEETYDAVLGTNLKGVFFLSQLVGKHFRDNNIKGNILNVASASSLRPANSAYTISKWGVRGLTLGLAKSLAPYGITVNGLAPGPTATPMLGKFENSNIKHDRLPLGRYIAPEEIAGMAVVLVSGMARSIMGDIVYMTGGAGILTYDDVPYSF